MKPSCKAITRSHEPAPRQRAGALLNREDEGELANEHRSHVFRRALRDALQGPRARRTFLRRRLRLDPPDARPARWATTCWSPPPRPARGPPMPPEAALGSINGGLFPFKADWPMQHPSVVIGVPDIRAAMQRIRAAGGEVHRRADDDSRRGRIRGLPRHRRQPQQHDAAGHGTAGLQDLNPKGNHHAIHDHRQVLRRVRG